MMNQLFKKVLGSVVAVAALALLFGASQSVVAQNANPQNDLAEIIRGDQAQVVKFQLSPLSSGDFGTATVTEQAFGGANFLRVFGDTIFSDVFVNENSIFSSRTSSQQPDPYANFNVGYSTYNSGTQGIDYPPELARFQVKGNVRVMELADEDDPNIYCVCADQFGEMRRCGQYDPENGKLCSGNSTFTGSSTYTWSTGDWGECIGNGGSCDGTYTTGICESDTHAETELFSNAAATSSLGTGTQFCGALASSGECTRAKAYEAPAGGSSFYPCVWNAVGNVASCTGAASEVACTGQSSQCTWDATGGTEIRTVVCLDELGNTVDDSLCSAPVPVETRSCNIEGGETETEDTYSWNIGEYGECTNGTETRSVVCENQDGEVVDDSFCPQPAPDETRSCYEYDWTTGPWGECDVEGGSCSGTPLASGSSACVPGAQLGSFPPNAPIGYDYVFSCAQQTTQAACADTIQTLSATAGDNDDVRYCQWEAPVPIGTKVDWNGDPFNWDPEFIYFAAQPEDGPTTDFGFTCGVEDPNDAPTASCIGTIVALPNFGTGSIDGKYWSVIPSGPSTGTWYPISLEYGNCGENANVFSCGTAPFGYGTPSDDDNTIVKELTVQSGYSNAYGTGGGGGNNLSCRATTEAACEAVGGCTWSEVLGGGTQVRDVACENQYGEVVDDSLCTDPEPTDAQSCQEQVDLTGSCEIGDLYPNPNELTQDDLGTCSAQTTEELCLASTQVLLGEVGAGGPEYRSCEWILS